MTALYLLPLDEIRRLPADWCAAHFPARTERAKRFRREEDALRCLGAGALLSAVLGIKEAELTENEYHKPYAPSCPVHFNLSHSGKYVLLATDDAPVGADIEAIDRSHLDLAKHVYTQEEQCWMAQDPEVRFFILWTLKESVMKQCGLGFHLPPQSFTVLPLTAGQSITANGAPVYAKTVRHEDYLISVCTTRPVDAVPLQILTYHNIIE